MLSPCIAFVMAQEKNGTVHLYLLQQMKAQIMVKWLTFHTYGIYSKQNSKGKNLFKKIIQLEV